MVPCPSWVPDRAGMGLSGLTVQLAILSSCSRYSLGRRLLTGIPGKPVQ
jgi:hypothetical protein